MRKSRFGEEHIIGILKEHEAGLSGAEDCRKHGISDATLYRWRSRFGGMDVSDAKRLRALEKENGKLKRLLIGRRPLGEGRASTCCSAAQGRGVEPRGPIQVRARRGGALVE